MTGQHARVRELVRRNGLGLTVVGLFLLIWLIGQTTAGQHTYNAERAEHGDPPVTFTHYLRTAHFGEATFENWESEFLQRACTSC